MENKISIASQIAFILLKNGSPYRTGNLRLNSITYEEKDKSAEIFIDEQIAPYAKYTNENWNLYASPLHGNRNPNQGWWNKSAEKSILAIANILNGELRKE